MCTLPKLNWTGEQLFVGERLRTGALLTLLAGDSARPLPITEVAESPEGIRLAGEAHGFLAEATYTRRQGSRTAYVDVELCVRYEGEQPVECALQVAYELEGAGQPTWLIPGAFYRENRLPTCTRIYPRYDRGGGDPAQFVSDSWSFRADRTALPAIFAWNEESSAALATAESSALGLSGVGFEGSESRTALWLNWPYREEPVLFLAPGRPGLADRPLHRFEPGTTVRLAYRIYVAGPELHGYDPFVRELYHLDKESNPLNPWMGPAEAAALTAHGLYRWHYWAQEAILCETAAFDREGGAADRPNMHVGWVSGVPYAFALLTYGRSHERAEYVEAGIRVIEKIASGVAPAGIFWGEWRGDRGWSQGWTPNKGWVQSRTISEAALFMLHALQFEAERGHAHPDWDAAVRSNLAYIARVQRPDGSFGAYYHAQTGEVMEWEGAGGLLWIAALLKGAQRYGEERFRAAALRAGAYYRRFVDEEFIYGAPEDVHLCPTSEDGYNAVIAFVHLYEATGEREWLAVASRAADWTMTFRWTYNLAFPKLSMLAQFDFRSRGADQASPSNQHLHNYGLICLPEMLRLWRYTGDAYYLERTRDNLACFLQFIARADGDFNAYKGMVTERYYNTNCFQPKGMMLTLSHAWSVGVLLYACQCAALYEREGLLTLPRS